MSRLLTVKYAIALASVIAGLSFGLWQSISDTATAKAELEQSIANEIMWKTQVTLVGDAHKRSAEELNDALLVERRAKRDAEDRAERALNEVSRIDSDVCFDKPIPDSVVGGLCSAAKAMSPSGSVQDGSERDDGTSWVPTTTYRDIVAYSVQVAERLQRCNGQLLAIKGLGINE